MRSRCTGLMGRVFGHKVRNDTVTVIMNEQDRTILPASLSIPQSFGSVVSGKFVLEFSKKRCQRCGAVTGENK